VCVRAATACCAVWLAASACSALVRGRSTGGNARRQTGRRQLLAEGGWAARQLRLQLVGADDSSRILLLLVVLNSWWS
jgi:hypothetical protein